MKRTAVVVDGFNLYFSAREAARRLVNATAGSSTKWLDLRALCNAYLHLVGGGAELTNIYYFSALPLHLQATQPGVIVRHQL